MRGIRLTSKPGQEFRELNHPASRMGGHTHRSGNSLDPENAYVKLRKSAAKCRLRPRSGTLRELPTSPALRRRGAARRDRVQAPRVASRDTRISYIGWCQTNIGGAEFWKSDNAQVSRQLVKHIYRWGLPHEVRKRPNRAPQLSFLTVPQNIQPFLSFGPALPARLLEAYCCWSLKKTVWLPIWPTKQKLRSLRISNQSQSQHPSPKLVFIEKHHCDLGFLK